MKTVETGYSFFAITKIVPTKALIDKAEAPKNH